MKIVIVGGVAGGASAAARLRRLDEQAEIVMLEKGAFISFANCGLPYYIGGEIKARESLSLQTPKSFHARFNVDVRVRSEALSIDRAGKNVTVKNLATEEIYAEAYDVLLLATGAEPVNFAPSERVFTLRSIPDALRIKAFAQSLGGKRDAHAAVIGGGAIGMEMAENLVKAGLRVTVVEMADHLIAPLDFDIAAGVHNYVSKMGVALRLGSGVKSIDEGERLTLHLSDGDLEADMAIMSVGVRPDTRLARESGLALGARGGIIVDAHMRSSDQAIYAVGDATEAVEFVTGGKAMMPLAGPANKQGRIAADNICGIESAYEGTQGSAILRVFDMAIASTGINERGAQAAGLQYDVVYLYPGAHASYYPGATSLWIKVLYEKGTGRLLGAQLTGFDGVDKRCDVLATAIRLGATAEDLTKLELCYAPPFGSAKDPVNMVGFMIQNLEAGLVKQIHWDEALSPERDVQRLDVRKPDEAARGMVAGFVNLPLDELRARIGELDQNRPVYVHCQTGLRSYIACRMLAGHGFDAANIAGGYQLYEQVQLARLSQAVYVTENK
ncbi:MAG: FAD-dependent oxidoreductase [Clostridia bacterium]